MTHRQHVGEFIAPWSPIDTSLPNPVMRTRMLLASLLLAKYRL